MCSGSGSIACRRSGNTTLSGTIGSITCSGSIACRRSGSIVTAAWGVREGTANVYPHSISSLSWVHTLFHKFN